MKSFQHQSRSRCGGIVTIYKSNIGCDIAFKTSFNFTHTSFEVVESSINLQHNTFLCFYRPPLNRRNNFTDSMFIEQLPDLLDYTNNPPGLVCLVGDMNIHFDDPLQSLTKHTLTTHSLNNLSQVISKPTHECGQIIYWVVVQPDDDIHKELLSQNHLNQTSTFQPLSLLPHAVLLATWLRLTVHHSLRNFLMFQSFHLLRGEQVL